MHLVNNSNAQSNTTYQNKFGGTSTNSDKIVYYFNIDILYVLKARIMKLEELMNIKFKYSTDSN